MTIFEAAKSMVTPRMAAEHYGMTVARNGMVCCPFHDDRHPSMKLYHDHFHCFGCQANGDVIEFTSKLFGITALEAAQKLAADFGIWEARPSVLAKLKTYQTRAENEKLCSGYCGSICTSCRTGKRNTHRRHPRKSRTSILWKPVTCSNVRSTWWIS